ncbi:hypothetical protein [Pseudomonas schmalbachii]|nr:hypothetical protein [Pseudomonas schmalbachii]
MSMTLAELIARYARRPTSSVPDWMLGFFKRRSISFANGETDVRTHVCWLQSRNFTIDLRLPLADQQVPAKALVEYSKEELRILANYEGWEALSTWDGQALSWHSDTSLQLHNRWPKPALLQRIGNCMIEFAPSGAYVEDWRLQPSAPGPLVGLRLIEERNLADGSIRHRGGGLIVCGEHAALVLGRAEPVIADIALRDLAIQAVGDAERLAQLFNFETSVAHGSLEDGYRITLSTRPERLQQQLLPLDGFELLPDGERVRQRLSIDGAPCERLFAIDTLEEHFVFEQATGFTPAARDWFERESQTLGRYTEVV